VWNSDAFHLEGPNWEHAVQNKSDFIDLLESINSKHREVIKRGLLSGPEREGFHEAIQRLKDEYSMRAVYYSSSREYNSQKSEMLERLSELRELEELVDSRKKSRPKFRSIDDPWEPSKLDF
jgi:hypothetical protein